MLNLFKDNIHPRRRKCKSKEHFSAALQSRSRQKSLESTMSPACKAQRLMFSCGIMGSGISPRAESG